MEKLMLSRMLLDNALATLADSFIAEEEAISLGNHRLILATQDSTIQRFEYSYDSFWKFLKIYFEQKFNLEDVNSPRSVFRTCVEKQICSESEGKILLAMIDDRNKTTHNYNATQVREIYPNISKYYDLIIKIITSIQ